jgi:hypothetical protein
VPREDRKRSPAGNPAWQVRVRAGRRAATQLPHRIWGWGSAEAATLPTPVRLIHPQKPLRSRILPRRRHWSRLTPCCNDSSRGRRLAAGGRSVHPQELLRSTVSSRRRHGGRGSRAPPRKLDAHSVAHHQARPWPVRAWAGLGRARSIGRIQPSRVSAGPVIGCGRSPFGSTSSWPALPGYSSGHGSPRRRNPPAALWDPASFWPALPGYSSGHGSPRP